MNKILLTILVALLPTALFSYELSFNKKFNKSVTPDLLTTYVTVSVEDDDETFINNKIEIFNEYIKSNKTITKKSGTYTLSPKYRYYKDKQEFTGYVGTLRYQIKTDDAKRINRFFDQLIVLKQKADSRKVKLNISNVTWIVSSGLYNETLDSLRLEAITWVNGYTTSLSQSTSKVCEVKKININNISNNILRANAMAFSEKASHVAPDRSNKEITISPNFVMECK